MGTRTEGPTGRAQDSRVAGEPGRGPGAETSRGPQDSVRAPPGPYLSRVSVAVIAACAAARRATGTRNGEQLT